MSAELNAKAQAWSEYMAGRGQLSHSSLSVGVSPGWSGIAENVAYNSGGLAAAQVSLQNSPGHRTNLLGNYNEVGLGVVVSSGVTWVTQVFVNRAQPTAQFVGIPGTSAYSPIAPATVLDTTAGGKVAAASLTPVQVAGAGGTPSNATAAVVTIESLDPVGTGWLQAVGLGSVVGGTANLNIANGDAANTTVVRLDNGRFSVYASLATHLRVTVNGYFAPVSGPVAAGRFRPMTPTRVFDTRVQVGYSGARPVANQNLSVQIAGRGGVPTTGAGAVAVNVAAVRMDGDGWVLAGASAGTSRSMHVNEPGQIASSLMILPVDAQGRINIRSSVGGDMVVDVLGWFTNASQPAGWDGLFVPINSVRSLDTRHAIGISTRTAVTSAHATVPGMGDMPACPRAVLGNVAHIPVVTPTYGQVGPLSGFTPGGHASVNAGTVTKATSNSFITMTGAYASIGVFTPFHSHVVVDLFGWFT